LGAVIGLTAVLVGTQQENSKKQKQEESRIQDEEYQEFLSQMEADQKFEEQNWQQSM